jgi:hypothetical protein
MYMTQLVISIIHRDEQESDEFVKYTTSRYNQYHLRGANLISCFSDTVEVSHHDDRSVTLYDKKHIPWPPSNLVANSVSSFVYLPFDPKYFGVDGIGDLLSGMELDEYSLLAMRSVEEQGKNRSGALAHIDAAIARSQKQAEA